MNIKKLNEELENLLKEQIVILGSITHVKDKLRKSGFSEPGFKFEPYYGKNRKYDGVKVTASEDNITSLVVWLDDNNYKYYNIHNLEESFFKDFILTDLKYKVTYNSGKSYEKIVSIVDTMNYKLYDLGTEQMADIVLKNLEDNGFKLGSNDSSHLDYDASTGIIKNTRPIAITDDIGEQKGTLSFEVTLWTPFWTHPERIERR